MSTHITNQYMNDNRSTCTPKSIAIENREHSYKVTLRNVS